MKTRRMDIWFLVILFVACGGPSPKEKPAIIPDGRIEGSEPGLQVGEPLELTISVDPPGVDTCYLVWSGNMGERLYPVFSRESVSKISIVEADLRRSGKVRLELFCGGQLCDSTTFALLPGPAVGLMETYAGPKSIIAGGLEQAMIAAIPVDSFGNGAFDREVNFGIRFPKRGLTISVPVEYHTAWTDFSSMRRTGKLFLGAQTGASNALEEHVYVTPSWPERFTIRAEQQTPYADGRSVSMIKTSSIRDAWNNTVADGTLIQFYFQENGFTTALYQAPTLGGIARLYFEHPAYPARWTVQAGIAGQAKSRPIRIRFERNLADLEASYLPEERILQVGPLRGALGQYLPDGYRVALKLSGDGADRWEYELLENGYCAFYLEELLFDPGTYLATLYAGDRTQTIELAWQ